jgi:hypothetical protein
MTSLQIFCGSGLPSAVFQPPPRPHSAAPRHLGPSAFGASRRFTWQLGGRRLYGGVVPIERILNLSVISVLEGEIRPSPVRRLPQIPYPAFRYLTLNPRGLAWPATQKISLGRARVKIIDGDPIECTVIVIRTQAAPNNYRIDRVSGDPSVIARSPCDEAIQGPQHAGRQQPRRSYCDP